VLNTCGQGGALVAAMGDQTTHLAITDRATWEFSLPAASTLAAATLWRAGDTAGGSVLNGTYQFWLASPIEPKAIDQCVAGLGCIAEGNLGSPLAPENRLIVPQERLGAHLYSVASCGGQAEFECPAGKGDVNNYAAVVYLYAADLTLEQTGGPTASAVGGELAGATSVAGTSDLTFNATDPGAGVYEAVFSVDGAVMQRTVLNDAGGHCREVGQTTDGLPAFLYLQPCLASVSAAVGFDTTRVANGLHHLTVSVLDAAGNSAPVLDRNVTVANPGAPGPPNGQGASSGARMEARWKSTPKALLKAAYGRSELIVGRLLDETGKPISGAQIEAGVTLAYAGAKSLSPSSLRTGSDGRFSLRLPPGASSRSLQLNYRARLGDSAPAASRTLQLTVRAPVSLKVTPRVSGVGRTIVFHGRLLAGPFPKGGKPVILEARAGKSAWIEFKVVHSDSRGRFHASYRFKFPGPVRYQFRVVCEHEADYPYATGASRIVGVFEH
jgi:hypothetical protein